MIRTFYLGVVLGVAAAAALVYLYPVVDLHREPSLIGVQANGRNAEAFQIRLPGDRIMAGTSDAREPTPPGLEWPEYAFLQDVRTELFKVRNKNGVVIGAASRMYGAAEAKGSFVEWTVHLPARGSMFLTMEPKPSAAGIREGIMRAGTREFLTLQGTVAERFVRQVDDPESENIGHIELLTSLTSTEGLAE